MVTGVQTCALPISKRALSNEDCPMTPLTRKALSRRTFIGGMGATLGLPLLDAMVPAATRLASVEALKAKRIGYTFIPMGADMTRWTPQGDNLDNLSYILEPLAPIRENVSVVSNLELRPAYPGSHATSNSAFLSAAKAKVTESTDYYLGTTVDQIAAQSIGQQTQLPSLELAMDMMQNIGQCDNGYACVYQPFLVVADYAASGRGASAPCIRKTLWRRRHARGSSRCLIASLEFGDKVGEERKVE